MLKSTDMLLKRLLENHSCLAELEPALRASFNMLSQCFLNKHVLYVCGNGGSAADAQHIVGELMKSFIKKRKVPDELAKALAEKYPEDAVFILDNLQGALPAHSLMGDIALTTAYMNDVCPEMVFAQQVSGYMKPGDVLWGITTSGESKNIVNAFKVADALGLDTLLLTGKNSSAATKISKVTIAVPETETYRVQELHLPIYHTLCMMLENEFFN